MGAVFKRVDEIKSFGVFKDYVWNDVEELKSTEFKEINILYGENYSGKTTLSRLFGVFQNKELPIGIEQPNFSISYEQIDYTHNNFESFPHNVVVYNEDFRKKNLSFFHNDNGSIESFTVMLSEENSETLSEIEVIKNELGADNGAESTGLYKEIYSHKQKLENLRTQKTEAEKKKNNFLKDKAQSIKLGKGYGDIRVDNYDRGKLEKDIDNLDGQFTPKDCNNDLIQKASEAIIANLAQEQNHNFLAEIFVEKVQSICQETAIPTISLNELDNNSDLRAWVKVGYALHVDSDTCKFYTREIPPVRKENLSKYFNDSYNSFQKKINDLLDDIKREIKNVKEISLSKKEFFYSEYKDMSNDLRLEFSENLKQYIHFLEELDRVLLTKRNQHLFIEHTPEIENFSIQELEEIIERYNVICKENFDYHQSLSENIKNAKDELLQNIVYSISNDGEYKGLKGQIDNLESDINQLSNVSEGLQIDIQKRKFKLIV